MLRTKRAPHNGRSGISNTTKQIGTRESFRTYSNTDRPKEDANEQCPSPEETAEAAHEEVSELEKPGLPEGWECLTDLSHMKILTENGDNEYTIDSMRVRLLILASKNGIPEIVEDLILQGVDVNIMDHSKGTPLHHAVTGCLPGEKQQEKTFQIVKMLVENGARIDAVNNEGATPLMLAIENALSYIVEYLISNGANVHIRQMDGWTAVHYTFKMSAKDEPQKTLSILKVLKENGANIDDADKKGVTPLMLASKKCLHEIVKYLISNGANTNATDKRGWTPVHYSIVMHVRGELPQTILDILRILTENGANIDAADKKGVTPLMLASKKRLPELVEYLILKGAKTNNTDKQGWTPVFYSIVTYVQGEQPQTVLDILQLLTGNGANIDAADKEGITPLMLASQYGFPEVIEYLISNGANVYATQKDGWTAVHYTIKIYANEKQLQTILSILRILIENGANIDAADKKGVTPLMLASKKSLPEVVEYLILKGANINVTDKQGWTPVLYSIVKCVKRDQPQIILDILRFLTSNGANIDAADKEGVTPLALAIQYGLLDVIEYLIRN